MLFFVLWCARAIATPTPEASPAQFVGSRAREELKLGLASKERDGKLEIAKLDLEKEDGKQGKEGMERKDGKLKWESERKKERDAKLLKSKTNQLCKSKNERLESKIEELERKREQENEENESKNKKLARKNERLTSGNSDWKEKRVPSNDHRAAPGLSPR